MLSTSCSAAQSYLSRLHNKRRQFEEAFQKTLDSGFNKHQEEAAQQKIEFMSELKIVQEKLDDLWSPFVIRALEKKLGKSLRGHYFPLEIKGMNLETLKSKLTESNIVQQSSEPLAHSDIFKQKLAQEEKGIFIQLTLKMLGISKGSVMEEVSRRAEALGLEHCPPARSIIFFSHLQTKLRQLGSFSTWSLFQTQEKTIVHRYSP